MKSKEHQNFENLLRAVVNVPAKTIKARLEDDRATKDWTKENNQPQHRNRRPIASLVPDESSKRKT